jgi:hypothetical protein
MASGWSLTSLGHEEKKTANPGAPPRTRYRDISDESFKFGKFRVDSELRFPPSRPFPNTTFHEMLWGQPIFRSDFRMEISLQLLLARTDIFFKFCEIADASPPPTTWVANPLVSPASLLVGRGRAGFTARIFPGGKVYFWHPVSPLMALQIFEYVLCVLINKHCTRFLEL